jgi:hypothetical protein
MNDKRYLQLSISALVTAIVIELGWIVGSLKPTQILLFKGFLLIISILIGIFFFLSYKYKINYSKIGLLNGFVEKINEVIPETAKGLTLILSVIIVTQIVFIEAPLPTPIETHDDPISTTEPPITTTDPSQTTEESTTVCPTPTPMPCVTCCAAPTPPDTDPPTPTLSPSLSPTPTETSTQTQTITPSPEIIGCVITFGLNVRTTPGVTASPSNHAHIWLRNDACMTILYTSTPEWARVQFEGFVRLKADETVYVGTVTPTPILTPSP